MSKRIVVPCLLPLALASVAAGAHASEPADADPRTIERHFLRAHPDLQYRQYGVEAYRRKDYGRALVLFRRAAFFADKPSQGMIAEMHARGEGVPRDMALAYAWMDLAAERGYRDFVLHRERYWDGMSEAERERAIVEGQAVYARYGDAAAKPRFATQLRRASKEGVGSRTGFGTNAQVTINGPLGAETFDGSKLKSFSYWDADAYWAMQDRVWRDPGAARVRVGAAERVRDEPAPSRIPEVEPEIDAEPPPVDEPR